MSGLDIEGTLVRHLYVRDDFSWLCACGKWRDKRDDGTGHRAHVAAVLREQIDGALAEAWEQAHAVFCPRGGGGVGHDVCSTHLRPGDRHLLAAHLSDTERAGDAE